MSGSSANDGAQSRTPPDNTLSISANGGDFTGWTSIRVTRRLEGVPSDFDVSLTDRATDGAAAQFQVKPGDPCTVRIADDVAITGYVDRVALSITGTSHVVRISGRGKCEDLVDCSIPPDQLHGMQITTSSLLDLATKLSAPYGVKVTSLTGDNVPVSFEGGSAVQFNAVLTETPFEIIERVARYAGVLAFEDSTGSLVLANVGTGQHSSGFAQGVNVQAAASVFTMDERYSIYLPTLMSVNVLGDQGVGGKSFPSVKDSGVPRFRELVVVSEQFQLDQSLAEKRAQWEAARRKGRSLAVHVTCDSWRDSAGLLWQPNYYAPVDIQSVRATDATGPWIISEVHYMVDQDRGTVADLLLMPKDAFQPEPTILRPDPWNPTALPASGGAANTTGGVGP
jgi:prophage tail gpP-like protein